MHHVHLTGENQLIAKSMYSIGLKGLEYDERTEGAHSSQWGCWEAVSEMDANTM